MKTVGVQKKAAGRQGVLIFALFAVMALLAAVCLDIPYRKMVAAIVMGCGVFVGGLCFWEDIKNVDFSETGILIKNLIRTRTVPWDQVIQVGIVVFRQGYPNAYPCMAFTLSGGTPRKRKQLYTHWQMHNSSKTAFCVPYSTELQELVLRLYGPLDFDLWNNPTEQSSVSD